MTEYTFRSAISYGNELPPFSQDQVRAEPMLFGADVSFARTRGGPITQAFLNALEWRTGIIDTRVHMLMPGWFPCIPGWHHDDVPRSRGDGQPNYSAPDYQAMHAMALVNGVVAPTQFALGSITLPHVDTGTVYGRWHPLVEASPLLRESAPDRRIIFFDWETFHQGTPARSAGWRWFGRMSWNTNRRPTNELRTQVQVYLPTPMEGW